MATRPRQRPRLPQLETLLEMLPPPPRIAPLANRMIDRVFHPLAEKRRDPGIYLLDTLAHFAVELGDQAAQSLVKALRYNAPRVLRLLESLEEEAR